MNKEGLKVAESIQDCIALAIDPKEDSKPERECPKLDPVLEPEKTRLCSPAVKCFADNFSFLFSLFLDDLTFQRSDHLEH